MIKGEIYTHPERFVISEQLIERFAEASGDRNPIHLDNEFAEKSIFKKRIAHGFLIGSLISNVLGNYFPGNGTIYLNQTMNFRRPVFIDDVITVSIEVIDINENRATLNTLCHNQLSKIVISGTANVIINK